MSLIINDLEIVAEAGFELTQSLKPVQSRTIRRLQNGAAVSMANWRKLETTISGSGYYPPGLDAIDWDAPVNIHCIQRQSISSSSNVIALPGLYRTDADYLPDAGAIVGGRIIYSPVNIVADVATITPVAGASQYLIQFFPVLSMFADLETDENIDGRIVKWRINGEET